MINKLKKKKNIPSLNTFFINTLMIIITNFIIKLLGLINKITITRVLGTTGMSLYVLSFPTIMLFISIAGFSLNITISKLVSEAIANRKYSPKKIVKNACIISLIISLGLVIIYLISLKFISNYLLKNESLYLPLLAGAPLILLVGISDGLKGYFSGIKKIHITTLGNLTEQIGRISFSLFFLFITIPFGIKTAVFFCLLALSIGELFAIVFSLIKIKKYPIPDFPNTSGETKAILSMAIPNTSSRLIGNFTYFLEPIIYTAILSYLGYDINNIQTSYTIFDAYTIPLLSFISFIPFAIANAMLPGISEANTLKKTYSIDYYIHKSFLFCLIPALILVTNLFFFGDNYMQLIYGTSEGTKFLKILSFIFIGYYLNIIIISILQGCGYSKNVFKTSTIINILRLLFIVFFSFVKVINVNSIIIATALEVIIAFISNFISLIKKTKYHFNYKNLFIIILIFIISMSLTYILKIIKIHYLIILILNTILIIGLSLWQKLIEIESFKKN